MPGIFGMWPGIIGAGLQSAGRATWKSPYGKSAIIGAGLGGFYGAWPKNDWPEGGTTFGTTGGGFGGAFKGILAGAAIGLGARASYGMGRAGLGMYNMARGIGMSRGQAGWQALAGLGRGSATLIGNTAKRAYNPIRSTVKAFVRGE